MLHRVIITSKIFSTYIITNMNNIYDIINISIVQKGVLKL